MGIFHNPDRDRRMELSMINSVLADLTKRLAGSPSDAERDWLKHEIKWHQLRRAGLLP